MSIDIIKKVCVFSLKLWINLCIIGVMVQLRENTKKHNISTKTAYGMTGRDYVRELVRTRDGYKCQQCGRKWQPNKDKKRLDVHHLNGLCGKLTQKADSIKDIDGLITLCHKCHFNHHEHSMVLAGRYYPTPVLW